MESDEHFDATVAGDERYRRLLEAVTDYAIYMLDAEGRVASWNPGARRFKGYEEAEIIGRHFSCFYTEADRLADAPGHALRTAARLGRFETEAWRVRKDGARFWAHVIIDPIMAPNGTPLGFAKVTRDISERRAAQERLDQSEERFRLLVDAVSDYAIYMLDPFGLVTTWNRGAERIKGYAAEEIIGQHVSRFYTEEDRERDEFKTAIATAISEGRYEREAWRVRKDGGRFWANVIIVPIRDDAGALLGFAKITRDITERLEARAALDRAREALFQSQKIEALGRLTGGVAHDFNNLLGVVIGSLDVARKLPPGHPKALSLMDNAIQGATRGVALTQRMLAFGRRQDLRLGPVDIPDLVRGMTELLQRSMGPAITIETRFPLRMAPAEADANQLELALLNLAMNARDAMPEGGSIVIAAREVDGSGAAEPGLALRQGRYIRLCVTDTGRGMDAATLARATEPFFTTKGVGTGTGLGLPMVQGMAEQAGGGFRLRSVEGKETTAEIWLPVSTHRAMPAKAPEAREAVPARARRPLAILAVDDDPLFLVGTTAMLEDLGHTVFAADSGEQALAVIRREAPRLDLVITDHAMPRMTGAQLARAIQIEWPDLPILLATGYVDLAVGADAALPKLAKPFDQVELAGAVAALMR
jgi:PAS domain S-box-containing protein